MNNSTVTDKKIIISVVAVLLIATGFLFLKGEINLKKASQGYDIVAFENTKQKIDFQNISNTLSFYIQNLEKNNNEYKITFLINDKPISEIKEQIKSGQKKIIDLPKEVTDKINNINSGSFEYKVIVNKDDEKKTIYKQIIK